MTHFGIQKFMFEVGTYAFLIIHCRPLSASAEMTHADHNRAWKIDPYKATAQGLRSDASVLLLVYDF